MGFVKTDLKKQIWPAFQGETGLFDAEVLTVLYETDRQALEAVIPPGLKLRGAPLVEVALNNFLHTNFDTPYKEAAVAVPVIDDKHGIEGKLVVAMTLNTDMGSFLGREANGYPKKVGAVDSAHDGKDYTAYCARHGVCYASFSCDTSAEPNDPQYEKIQAEFNGSVPFKPGSLAAFNYIWPYGLRSRIKPILQPMWLTINVTQPVKVGRGDIHLNWSRHDPWASLPVVKVVGANVTTGQVSLISSEEKYYTEIDPEAYLPYSFYGWDEPHDA